MVRRTTCLWWEEGEGRQVCVNEEYGLNYSYSEVTVRKSDQYSGTYFEAPLRQVPLARLSFLFAPIVQLQVQPSVE